MSLKALITKAVSEEGLKELRKKYEILMPEKGESFSGKKLLSYAPEVDAVIQAKVKIKEDFIRETKKLKIISVLGAGYDGVDLEAANQ